MRILKTEITQIIIVKRDEIPLRKLLPRQNAERLANHFDFSRTEISVNPDGGAAIHFQHGIHRSNGGECVIDSLRLEDRRFLIKLGGSSDDANAFFDSLAGYLADEAGHIEDHFLRPIVHAEESEIAVQLGFHFEELLSKTYMRFINSEVPKEANSDLAEASIRPVSLRFHVDYLVRDHSLPEQHISLNPKEFTVEPRRGYPLKDAVYYSKAPFSTGRHIKLLQELEQVIMSQKGD